jgi:hypothetical protein
MHDVSGEYYLELLLYTATYYAKLSLQAYMQSNIQDLLSETNSFPAWVSSAVQATSAAVGSALNNARSVSAHIDALVDTPKRALEDYLAGLSVDNLKAVAVGGRRGEAG